MEKAINLNISDLEKILKNEEYEQVADQLKSAFSVEKDQNDFPIRQQFKEECANLLINILRNLKNKEWDEKKNLLLEELFRAFRNYVTNIKTQIYLSEQDDFLLDLKFYLSKFIEESSTDALKIMLQFLINFMVSNKTIGLQIHDVLLDQILVLLKNEQCVYEVAALLYNLSFHIQLSDLSFDFYETVLTLQAKNHNIEFLYFLIEKLLMYESFWLYYEKFQINQRITILEIIRNMQIKGNPVKLSENAIKLLSKHFVQSGPVIYKTVCDNTDNLEPFEVAEILEVLAALCADESYLIKYLQNDKDLLINAGVLLINLHRLGKESENYFSSLQKLSEIRNPNELIKNHPAFGLKVALIRIIGNLCWRNKNMQDLVREAELIPVLLDCCNIDARNPFIMQWVILALRNLCENNLENQQIIRNMRQEGTVSSDVLEEFGLNLHSDEGNSIKIVPYDALKR